MKKILLSLVAVFATSSMFAQYQITAELYTPEIGDEYTYANDSLSSITPDLEGGGSQTWDFTIENTAEVTISYGNPDTAVLGEDFPDAEVVLNNGFFNQFLDIDSDGITIIGGSGAFELPNGETYEGSGENMPPLTVLEYPSTFNSSVQGASDFQIAIFTEGADLGGITADSIKITQNILDFDAEFDAWGDLTVNGDTYTNVMRENIGQVTEFIIEACVSVLPGLPCQYQPFVDEIDSTRTFNYYFGDNKFPIVQIQTDYDSEIPFVASYDIDAEPRAVGVENIDNSIEVFPTIANSTVELRAEGNASVLVMNTNGQVVENTNFNGASTLDVSNFANGTYLVVVSTSNGRAQEKIVVSH